MVDSIIHLQIVPEENRSQLEARFCGPGGAARAQRAWAELERLKKAWVETLAAPSILGPDLLRT